MVDIFQSCFTFEELYLCRNCTVKSLHFHSGCKLIHQSFHSGLNHGQCLRKNTSDTTKCIKTIDIKHSVNNFSFSEPNLQLRVRTGAITLENCLPICQFFFRPIHGPWKIDLGISRISQRQLPLTQSWSPLCISATRMTKSIYTILTNLNVALAYPNDLVYGTSM